MWGHLKRTCQDHPAGFSPEQGWEEALILARWPVPDKDYAEADQFELVKELVRAIRNVRAEKSVPARREIPVLIQAGESAAMLQGQAQILASLARLDPEQLEISEALQTKPENAVPLVVGSVEAYLPLKGMLDLDEERKRLSSELEDAGDQINRLEKLLASPFAEKAPADVVARERERLESFRDTAGRLKAQLDALE